MAIDYWQPFESGVVYHIYNRTVSDLELFRTESDYSAFLDKYDKYFSSYFDIYAYCLIPNHFHLLIKVKSKELILETVRKENTRNAFRLLEGEISIDRFIIDQFRRFLSSISIKYNNQYDRRGPVLMKRFKRVSVETSKLDYMVCYIHHNPIHHKLRTDYWSWEYSSYKSYLSENSGIIDQSPHLDEMGGIGRFHELHDSFQASKKEVLHCD